MGKRILSILLALILAIGTIPNLFIVEASAATITVFSQTDSRWGSHKYGYSNTAGTTPATISSGGCGILSLVNAVYYMNGNFINPITLADWSVSNGYRVNGVGTSHSLYPAYSKAYGSTYGFSCTSSSGTGSWDTLKSHLKNGGTAIVPTTTYATGSAHLLVIADYDSSNSTYLVLDSYASSYRGTSSGYGWMTKAQFQNRMSCSKFILISNTSSGHTTHSYSGSYYEAAHPHKVYQKCSCGATKYTGANKTVSSCSSCSFTQDSKYGGVKGFKAYPCVTSNFEVKTSDLSTRAGEIYTSDYCTINELYTNGWCKVTFPLDSGGTKTAYTEISNFIKFPSTTMGTFTAQAYMNLYSTSSMSTKIFRVYPNDNCITIGKSGSATQVFMPHTDGYYVLGWVKTSEIPGNSSYSIDSRYPTPFKCRVLSSSKVPAALTVGGARQSDMNVYVDDDCVIQEVYTNGWCKFTCPWSDGSTKTLYLPLSEFINANIEPYTFKATQYTDTYYKSDKATKVGWIDEGDSVTVVSKSGNMTQAIYPADVGKRCGWANSSALTTTYTVTFNANGGSGAPGKQSKTPGTALTLSSTKPTRTGYTFVGWATSSSATTAQYSAGSVYTNDSSVTLYAVWRKQSFTIAYNANGGANAPGAQTQTYGTAITVTSSKPEKAYDVTFNANGGEVDTDYYSLDCSFASWNTKSNGSGTTVNSGASYTPNANVTLYAIYTNPKLGNYPIPSREGYTFDGWYTAKTGGTRVDATTVISGDTTLYAQWSLETYSVIYFDDGAENIPDEQTKTHGTSLILSTQVPSKNGYVFKGWTTSEGSNTVVYQPGETYSENEWIILYPVWEKIITTPLSITIDNAEVQQGDTVSIKVSVDDNPGIWGMDLKISYDKSALTLVSVNNGDFYQDSEWTPGNLNGDVYVLSYEASGFEDITTESAVLATLNFKVNNTATVGEYTIVASYDSGDIINVNFDDITASITNGKITVKAKSCSHNNTQLRNSISATCTTAGYTGDAWCLDCGIKVSSGSTISALGHNYVDGHCEYCGEKDPRVPDSPEYNYTFSIQLPSRTEIRHKDGIILHANIEGTVPDGCYVKWVAGNDKFKTEEINGGDSFKIISDKNGYTTITATLYDADGNELAHDTIEMRSKAGFFDKIGSFFRSLFGGTKIFEN